MGKLRSSCVAVAFATLVAACEGDVDVDWGSPGNQGGDGDFGGPNTGGADASTQTGDGDQGAGPGDGDGNTQWPGGDGDTQGPGDGDGDTQGPGDGDGDMTPPMTPVDPEPGRLAGITRLHNEARARVGANPAIPPLSWSPEIAQVAQAYADKLAADCTKFEHSKREDRNYWGENLAWYQGFGAPVGSASATVKMWEDEKACYTYSKIGAAGECSAGCEACGHYTQVVWRNTTQVGCGAADCASGKYRGTFWVCNYNPPGNYGGQYPY